MKLGLFKRISREDLGGSDVPDWVDGLLGAINQNLETMSIAMTGKLTFMDNFFCTVSTQTFSHGKQLLINPGKAHARIIGVMPIYASSGYLIDSSGFSVQQSGSVGVTIRFLNSDGSAVTGTPQVKCTVLILFG